MRYGEEKARYRGDMGEIKGRYRGDAWEIQVWGEMGLAPAEAALRRDGGQLAEHLIW